MHRKIRAVVRAGGLDVAIETAVEGLEAAMDKGVLANGTLQTLVGDHAANDPFGPSSYFDDDREQAGYRIGSAAARQEFDDAVQDMARHNSTFVYSIDDRPAGRTATPLPSDAAIDRLRTTLQSKSATHWIVTFDLRYDYDATPHKPYEILDR